MNKNPINKIAVIGAGSWGTAIAMTLSRKGLRTVLWGHNESHIQTLQKDRENKKYLNGFPFPDSLKLEVDLKEAATGADVVCMVIPSHVYRSIFRKLVPYLKTGSYVVSAVKGIENKSLMTMTQVMRDTLGSALTAKNLVLSVLSGPSFAQEVVMDLPTLITIGCDELHQAQHLQNVFCTERFRVYAAEDMIGIEISAALKNVVAIATGICDGLQFGLNSRAALITRGLAEITRMGVAMGANPATFSGLSGLGDLILTCTGDLSRNRTVGLKLGEGQNLPHILDSMEMVAEGVKTTESAQKLALQLQVEMPILEQVYKILYQDKQCSAAVTDLLTRELKPE